MNYYIVANKRQELYVLSMLEDEGFMWVNSHKLPTEHTVSEFPHVIIADNKAKEIMWSARKVDFEYKAVFDGRKEEKMIKKYKVTKGFILGLSLWRDSMYLDATTGGNYAHVGVSDLDSLPKVVNDWWLEDKNPMERNRRLIAIISWLSGEDSVFEVEEPHKFVVRSDKTDNDGDYAYVIIKGGVTSYGYYYRRATKFDTYEEASEWANSHQVVIEVYEDGKEV